MKTTQSFGIHFTIRSDKEKDGRCGCFGDMLHPIPWQTDHLFCWQRIAAHALAA